MRAAYYGLGGGHGHGFRGIATLARLRRLEPTAKVTLLAPARLRAWADWGEVPMASPPSGVTVADALSDWLREVLAEIAPDVLLVDVFPRGVLGELTLEHLAPIAERWLVSRWVRPQLYLAAEVRAAIESRYAGILWCERAPAELSELRVPQRRINPVLLQGVDDCLGREAARAALGVAAADRLVLALGSGDARHQSDLLRLLERILARRGRNERLWFASDVLVDLEGDRTRVGRLVPAMRYLRAADAAVAAAGYHACHEIQALGLDAVYVPQSRAVDDQFRRAGARGASSPAALAAALGRALDSGGRVPMPAARGDGAEEIASLVLGRPQAASRDLEMPS